MLTKTEMENKIIKIINEKKFLTLDEFISLANMFFQNIKITTEMIDELANNGYLRYVNELKVVLASSLLEFNPYSLLSISEFAERAGITEKEVEKFITKGEIKTLSFMNKHIHIKEFRNYAKEHDIEAINNFEDLYKMLDNFFRLPSWWDNFYSNREKPIPFFVDVPDENLVSYFEKGIINPKKVLEIGCGNGRNAIFLAKQGCRVDAIDISKEAISWAKEMANAKNVNINFINESIFNLNIEDYSYDFVYDVGCFHHVPPHRRFDYKNLIRRALKPGKHFALNCLNPKMGSGLTDWETYQKHSLGGGLAYTKKEIKKIFSDVFELKEFREMKEIEDSKELFGDSTLWTMLFEKITD